MRRCGDGLVPAVTVSDVVGRAQPTNTGQRRSDTYCRAAHGISHKIASAVSRVSGRPRRAVCGAGNSLLCFLKSCTSWTHYSPVFLRLCCAADTQMRASPAIDLCVPRGATMPDVNMVSLRKTRGYLVLSLLLRPVHATCAETDGPVCVWGHGLSMLDSHYVFSHYFSLCGIKKEWMLMCPYVELWSASAYRPVLA